MENGKIFIQTEIRKYVGYVEGDRVVLTTGEAVVSQEQLFKLVQINADAIKNDAEYAGTYTEHIKAAEEEGVEPDNVVVDSLKTYTEHLGYLRTRRDSLTTEWALEPGDNLYFNKPDHLDELFYKAITMEKDTDKSFVTTLVQRICMGSKLEK